MPSLRYFVVFCVLTIFAINAAGQAKDKHVNFPTDGEIRLVLTQADHAI